jgi:ABC-type multidrug transport system fused ATPase/permease subunit
MLASFIIVAALDTIGIALFFPLVISLVDPDSASMLPMLGAILPSSLADKSHGMALLLSGAMAALFIVKNVLSVVLLRWQFSLLFKAETVVGTKLFEQYLRSPWPQISNRNSSELIRNASVSCSQVFLSFFVPLTTIIVELILLLVIFFLLLFLNAKIALLSAAVITISGGLYYLFIKSRLNAVGEQFQRANFEVLNELKQGIGAGREVRVLGRQSELIARLYRARVIYANSQAARNILTQLPRYYLETVLVLVVFLAISLMTFDGDPAKIVPILAVFGVASLRLMSSAGKVLAAFQQLRMGAPAVVAVCNEFAQINTPKPALTGEGRRPGVIQETGLVLDGVTFKYPGGGDFVLQGIDVQVAWGECLGIVGPSGSGKSTLFDIMIGLLPPTTGSVRVDGAEIAGQRNAWLSRIGYVPQTVYLSDETLRQSIAFGVPSDEIDDDSVRMAIRLARLEEFVDQLPQGMYTPVGEQGAAISGGQRQRIGIARALYHDPDVLFFDEATSALDGETERLVVESIEMLRGSKTIVVIAHRLSTLRPCNRILTMSNGMLEEVHS